MATSANRTGTRLHRREAGIYALAIVGIVSAVLAGYWTISLWFAALVLLRSVWLRKRAALENHPAKTPGERFLAAFNQFGGLVVIFIVLTLATILGVMVQGDFRLP